MADDLIAGLEPCPFCGTRNALFLAPDEYGSGGQHVLPYHVGCRACRVSMVVDEDRRDVPAHWNKRAALRAEPVAELLYRVRVQTGEEGDDGEGWGDEVPDEKLRGGDIRFGARVTIEWAESGPGEDDGGTDDGYITTLPSITDTPDMAAVVHVPEPWGEKGAADPVWITLTDLLRLEHVAAVVIEGKDTSATPREEVGDG